jgi:hypothetical protein
LRSWGEGCPLHPTPPQTPHDSITAIQLPPDCPVSEVVPGPVPPFPGGADFRRLTGRDGQSYPTRTRLGCCLFYTIRPAEACGTCPRTCDAERLHRLEEAGPS